MPENNSVSTSGWKKLLRYARTYGLRRALVKAAGRTRGGRAWMLGPRGRHGDQNVSVIGCGQAAFATLCHFVYRARGPVFLDAFDTDLRQANSLAKFYHFSSVAKNVDALLASQALRTLYIASNHSSHAPYAVAALQRGLDVFVEKPIATNWGDLRELEAAAITSSGRLWAGYNRPFARAIRQVRDILLDTRQPLSLVCTVHGHVIPSDHWYRRPEEGTRISGNAGHWLDLFVHLTSSTWRGLPDEVEIELVPEDPKEPDDNYRLYVRTANDDSLVLNFTSHYEPPEGVWESIVVNGKDTKAAIDDFREMSLITGGATKKFHYRPKDVGHRQCALQPWCDESEQRDIEEVWRSARLVLFASDLTRRGGGIMRVNLSSTPSVSFDAA